MFFKVFCENNQEGTAVMKNILERLYFETVHQNHELYAKDPAYADASQLKESNYEKLLDTLNEPEKEWFEKFLEADGELRGIEHYNTFTYAFRLGALLMIEIFAGRDQVTEER